MIRPHLPVRAPCYDFLLLKKHRLVCDHSKMITASSIPFSPQATGGVCKLQGSIQDVIMKHPYYAFHVHVGAYSPQFQLRPDLEVGFVSRRCISLFRPLRLACGPECKGHTDLIWPSLSSASAASDLVKVPDLPKGIAGNRRRGSRYVYALKRTPHGTS